ncbi:hypothetical protein, partial [Klebsiella pneumoniae]|uniref:hypothetical protein n=1 Tax=Klebsiella pneumoniae TaxID=573 RepID=UPI002148BD7E
MKISQPKLSNALNESQVCAKTINSNDAVNITSFILNRCQHRHATKFSILRFADGTVAKLAMRQPFVLFKGLTFQKLCLPGAFRPGDHHN